VTEHARQPVYVFEGFRLDAQRRVLHGTDSQPIPLTPRLSDTLLYFVERAGQLLPKEQLLEALWPNVVVEEHNLNKIVSELRRVLGERPGEHRFIVTKSGRGYRFVADVAIEPRAAAEIEAVPRNTTVDDAPAAGAPPAPANGALWPAARRRHSVWATATVAIVIVAAGVALVGNRAFGPREPEWRVTSWSSQRGGQRAAVWSPDGRATAFVARGSVGAPAYLYVRELGSSVPRQIVRFADADLGATAQWTSNDKILFWDQSEDRSGLWSVSPVGAGASPELVAPIDFDIALYGPFPDRVMDVTRDGSMIASIGRTADGMVGVFTATLPDAKLERYAPDPFVAHGTLNGIFLRFSPDGKQLLLWWNASRGEEEAWLLPIPGDATRPPRRVLERLPPAPTGSSEFSWLPDSRHIVVSAGPGPPRTLYLADTQSGRFRRLSSGPNRPSGQVFPAVSPDGEKLLYIERRYDYDIVTLDLSTAIVTDLLASDDVDQTPAWAARTNALVYATFRTGASEIWLRQPQLPDRPIVTARDFQSPTLGPSLGLFVPDLSPDGARVVYHRVEEPTLASAYLWMSAVGGSAPQRLTNASAFELGGVWSPDGDWVAYFATEVGSGRTALMKVKTTGQAEPQTLLAEAPAFPWLPVWSPDGEWILLPSHGLLVAADGTGTRKLGIEIDFDVEPRSAACAFAAKEPLLYCLQPAQSDGQHPLVMLKFDGELVRTIGYVSPEDMPATGVRPGLRLSPTPDGTGVTYAVSKMAENLQLMDGLSSVPLP
jgi:Tol biopolymer transport system component/DNA-binding winged helix-turn-helix (wHTH) protein